MATDNIALVRQMIDEAWNKGNLSVLPKLIADNFIGRETLFGEVRGPNGLKTQLEAMRKAFPDMHLSVNDIGMVGDRVFVRWTGRGTHRGPLMGIAATGKVGEVPGISIYRIAQGRIVEHYASWDALKLMQTIGVVPSMDQMTKRGGAMPADVSP